MKSAFYLLLIVVCLAALFVVFIGDPSPPGVPAPLFPPSASSVVDQGLPENGFCLAGCPRGAPHDTLVIHHIYELSNNPTTKFADWVAYRITADTLGSGCKRTWEEDPDLDPETTLRPTDYRGFRAELQSDRGHQAPLASLCGSPDWHEADYLSNITPQKTDLNEGAWERLERSEREMIEKNVTDVVYSLTGPLYERQMEALPHAHLEHQVPSGYWKIVSLRLEGKLMAVAFVMDQETPREADICGKKVLVKDLEQRAHLVFFPQLSVSDKADLDSFHVISPLFHALGC